MPRRLAVALLVVLAGCGSGRPGTEDPPTCKRTSCASVGATCGTIDDGCGGRKDCGTCDAPDTCGGAGVENTCGHKSCVPETSTAICLRLSAQCGSVTVTDNCGAPRTVACGSCATGTCTANHCLTTAKAPGDSCSADADCAGGSLARCAKDLPGGYCLQIGCEACPSGSICIPLNATTKACVAGPCTSDAQCARHGEGYTCDTDGSCWWYPTTTCEPERDVTFCDRVVSECGTTIANDNCGDTRTVECGTCRTNWGCGDNRCQCTPETDAQLCAAAGRVCGSFTVTDRCGNRPTPYCGSCGSGTCNVTGRCGACVPESDAQFCTRLGAECGTKSGVDNCGVTRAVTCGPCVGGYCRSDLVCVACDTPVETLCAAANTKCGGKFVTACGESVLVDCGACGPTGTCDRGRCVCNETDAQACSRLALGCGYWEFTDQCGNLAGADCGECATGVCNAKGVAGQCAPLPLETLGGGTSAYEALWFPVDDRAWAFGQSGKAASWAIPISGTGGWTALNGLGTKEFVAVDGTSLSSALAVGLGGAIYSFDGLQWLAPAISPAPTQDWISVWASAAPNTFYLLQHSGSTRALWKLVLSTAGNSLTKISPILDNTPIEKIDGTGSGATEQIWGVGSAGLYRFQNGSWKPKGSFNAALDDLWVAGPDDVWVVGGSTVGRSLAGVNTVVPLPPISFLSLYSVEGTGPNDVWVGGGIIGGRGELLRWDGAKWIRITLPVDKTLFDVRVHPTRVLAVGEGGVVVRIDR